MNDIQVNISTSAMKPLQAKWLITVHSKLKNQKDIIQRGFEKGGITFCFSWSDVEDFIVKVCAFKTLNFLPKNRACNQKR